MDSYLRRLQDAITSATSSMTTEDLAKHPEGKWSSAQILEHLYLTYTGTAKGFQRCLREGKPLARRPTLNDRMKIFVVTRLSHLPEGRKSPERAQPRGLAAEDVLRDVGVQLKIMDEAISQCEIRFGKRTRVVDHPILGPLTSQQWRKFHWVHGQLHIKQIWKLRGKN